MRLGEGANAEAARWGRPLDGVRVLALEQMQSLPWATQLMARLGAEVIKVEHPVQGESGRGALPAMADPAGRRVGATFLRNNLNKKSLGLDLKHPVARELLLRLAPRFDVVAENFKAGALDAMGLGYEAVRAVHPSVIYLSVSGFGSTVPTPYRDWPAYAAVAEAMSGIYEYSRLPHQPPVINPVGPLGDVGTACIATVGVLAALLHRARTGEGQQLDVAMLDCMVAFCDLVTNFWSMGVRRQGEDKPHPQMILDAFRAADGWFMVQVGREHQFERLAAIVGCQQWLSDPRLQTRQGWADHIEDVIRPAVEAWAADKTKLEACRQLAAAGVAAGPCNKAPDVIADPHVAARHMLVECPRTDGVAEPVLVPGNPLKMSKVADGFDRRVPWLGEHTDEVLSSELGLSAAEIAELRRLGAVG